MVQPTARSAAATSHQGGPLQGCLGHATACDKRCDVRGFSQADERSGTAQESSRADKAGGWPRFLLLRENGDRADKSKSGVDNLAAALGLNNKDSAGWDMLASFADDPTGGPLPERNGALCDLPIPRSTARRSMT